jgi:molecular chaperone GrpE
MTKKPETQTPAPETPAQPSDQTQELIGQLQRLQAEFENYRKRVDAQSQDAAAKGQEKLIKELLPAIDSLELAIKHYGANHKQHESDLLKGIELVYSQLKSTLENLGVHRAKADGLVDPRLHEVYLTETSDAPSNTILEVLQHGYVRHGTVLRTAKVKAARKE